MKCLRVRHSFPTLLTLLCISVLLGAGRASAVQFTARTLDGQSITSSELRGDVVLLQFWATWCPVCQRDQAAVDNIGAAFSGRGLVVLAVDDGEPEAVVRAYLQSRPRSCKVALDESRSLAARFGVYSYPHYVVIDRNGDIVASRAGGGGEANLRSLLSRAGLSSRAGTLEARDQGQPSQHGTIEPRMFNVPSTTDKAPAKPLAKTIFVLAGGEQFEADHYMLGNGVLHVTVAGQDRDIPLDVLDVKTTLALNHQRGIDLKIPTSTNQIFLAF